jgi:surface protein
MSSMFYNCKALTSLDLSTFNISKVTSLGSTFRDCTSLTTLNFPKSKAYELTDVD